MLFTFHKNCRRPKSLHKHESIHTPYRYLIYQKYKAWMWIKLEAIIKEKKLSIQFLKKHFHNFEFAAQVFPHRQESLPTNVFFFWYFRCLFSVYFCGGQSKLGYQHGKTFNGPHRERNDHNEKEFMCVPCIRTNTHFSSLVFKWNGQTTESKG